MRALYLEISDATVDVPQSASGESPGATARDLGNSLGVQPGLEAVPDVALDGHVTQVAGAAQAHRGPDGDWQLVQLQVEWTLQSRETVQNMQAILMTTLTSKSSASADHSSGSAIPRFAL